MTKATSTGILGGWEDLVSRISRRISTLTGFLIGVMVLMSP